MEAITGATVDVWVWMCGSGIMEEGKGWMKGEVGASTGEGAIGLRTLGLTTVGTTWCLHSDVWTSGKGSGVGNDQMRKEDDRKRREGLQRKNGWEGWDECREELNGLGSPKKKKHTNYLQIIWEYMHLYSTDISTVPRCATMNIHWICGSKSVKQNRMNWKCFI